jgi:hypothetical protein
MGMDAAALEEGGELRRQRADQGRIEAEGV